MKRLTLSTNAMAFLSTVILSFLAMTLVASLKTLWSDAVLVLFIMGIFVHPALSESMRRRWNGGYVRFEWQLSGGEKFFSFYPVTEELLRKERLDHAVVGMKTYKRWAKSKKGGPSSEPNEPKNYRIARDAYGRYTKVYDLNAPHDPEELAAIEEELDRELKGESAPRRRRS